MTREAALNSRALALYIGELVQEARMVSILVPYRSDCRDSEADLSSEDDWANDSQRSETRKVGITYLRASKE